MEKKKKIKAVVITLVMATLCMCITNSLDYSLMRIILGDLYVKLYGFMGIAHFFARFILIGITAFLYVKGLRTIARENKDIEKEYTKTVGYTWTVFCIVELIVQISTCNVGEDVSDFGIYIFNVLYRMIVNILFILIGIVVCKKIANAFDSVENGILESGALEQDIDEETEVNDNKEVEGISSVMVYSQDEQPLVKSIIFTFIAVGVSWIFYTNLYMYPFIYIAYFSVLVALIGLVFGIVGKLMPLWCALYYVIKEKTLHKKAVLFTWLIGNVVVGGIAIAVDVMKQYRNGNISSEVVDIDWLNMAYVGTTLELIWSILGTIVIVKIIKKIRNNKRKNRSNLAE